MGDSKKGAPPVRGWVTAAAVAAVSFTSCARQGAPPGGPEDRRPPVIVRTVPDTLAHVPDFRGPVRFVFDERISERIQGLPNDIVTVSPRTGNVRVSLGRTDVSVELDGGFQPGRVYRVTLEPAVSDLFNNRMGDAFELVFSTGGDFHPTAVAGFAWDRLDGRGVDGARVHLRAMDDDSTTVHVARADTGGLYAMRYVPPGRYRLTAFLDNNRNAEVDPGEPQGEAIFVLAEADTLLTDLPLLAPDSTPARVIGVEVLDSMTLVVRFDDHLDPAVSVRSAGVGIQPDSGAERGVPTPGVERIYHVWEYNRWVDEVADSFARLDSLEAAEAAALREARARAGAPPDSGRAAPPDPGAPPPPDSGIAAPPDSVAPAEEPAAPPVRRVPPRVPPAVGAAGRRPGAGPGGGEEPLPPPTPGSPSRLGPFPEQRIVVTLNGALPVNQPLRLLVTGIRNLNGLPLGGGQAAFVRSPPPAPPDSVPADTLGADSLGADTLAAPSTLADTVPADTLPRDTIPPDTVPQDPVPRP